MVDMQADNDRKWSWKRHFLWNADI